MPASITAVIATYNEEAHIGPCLTSLLQQQGLDCDFEILVVDGMSTDRTVDIVRSFPEFGTKIRLLTNARRLHVHAWNLALRQSDGEFFAMIVAHAQYSPTYFATCLDVMHRTGAAAVGGVQRPCGKGLVGSAVAFCMGSPFGVGNARFRYTRLEEESDSVFSIFTRCETLRRVGGFDECIPFDEDSELSYRLRRSGGKIVTSPRIMVRYYVRESLKSLWKQMFRYGYWRHRTQLKHPRGVPLRVLAPPGLIAGLAFSAAIAGTHHHAVALIVPAAYAVFISAALLTALARIQGAAFAVPFTLVTMHAAYGIGYWVALLTAMRVRTRVKRFI
jgi:glycosyltransferase involved in cell wall biosynthesis